MKKILAVGLISAALSTSLAQAGVFVGVQGGYDVATGYASSGKTNAPIYDGRTRNSGWSVGGNVGYELDLGYFGARTYLQVDYSRFIDAPGSDSFHAIDVDLNADALINFVNSDAFGLGLFAGIGVGYQWLNYKFEAAGLTLAENNINNVPLFARVGLTFKLLGNSRIDLGVKLPIVGWNVDDRFIGGGIYSPLKVQASYKFLF